MLPNRNFHGAESRRNNLRNHNRLLSRKSKRSGPEKLDFSPFTLSRAQQTLFTLSTGLYPYREKLSVSLLSKRLSTFRTGVPVMNRLVCTFSKTIVESKANWDVLRLFPSWTSRGKLERKGAREEILNKAEFPKSKGIPNRNSPVLKH